MPGDKFPESKLAGPEVLVTVCVIESLLVHITVVSAEIVVELGENDKLTILIEFVVEGVGAEDEDVDAVGLHPARKVNIANITAINKIFFILTSP